MWRPFLCLGVKTWRTDFRAVATELAQTRGEYLFRTTMRKRAAVFVSNECGPNAAGLPQ